MTVISNDDVQHLAQLSSLSLQDEEIDRLRQDLTQIVSYFDQLAELDTDGVEPTYQVTGLENVWRDDVVETPAVSRDDLLRLAPTKDNQLKVPRVL